MRQTARGAVAVLALALIVARGTGTEKQPASRTNPIVEAVKKTKASIVSLKSARQGTKDMTGTGVIVDARRGLIVTNRHVIGPNKTVTIQLHDGTSLQGQVLLADASVDLGVVQIKTNKTLQELKPAPVSDLMVGETVIAVGHPYGYTNTVSTGIISALDREIRMPAGDVLTGLIQIDASINPGNSGGPLLNINGELIGINVALRDGAQGIAFAINAGTVEQLLARNFSAERVSGVRHGLLCREKVLAQTGPRQRLMADADVPEAGLEKGDEILAVGDVEVVNSFDLERALWDKRPGDTVALKVNRDGQTLTVQLTLQPGRDNGVAQSANPSGLPDAASALRGVADKNR